MVSAPTLWQGTIRDKHIRSSLEPLEPRLLLSALTILGTAGDDTITITQDAGGITVTTASGSDVYAGSYSSIVVDAMAGNDVIRLGHSVSLDSLVHGGEGKDTIFDASTGLGEVHGGAGDDLLVTVGSGADVLSGGEGFDSFWSDSVDVVGDADATESLRTLHVIYSFYQPYTSDPLSPDYVSLEIEGQNLRDPTASGYQSFATTPLFVDGPQYDDAVQGSVGDCYFISSLASLADAVPGVIEQAVAPLGDGTYAVRFIRDSVEHFLRVDADLPASGGTPTYAKLGPDGELWGPLIEKAYAYFRHGQNTYASLASGYPSDAYEDITGSDYANCWTGLPEATIQWFLSTHLSAGHAVAAPSEATASSPITKNHGYMVKSMEVRSGTTYVMLYDPWGSLREITLSQLKSNFMMVTASLASDNRLPLAGDDSAVTAVDTAVIINVIANDSDPEGDPLSVTDVGTAEHGIATNNGDGTITYAPAAGFMGTDTFTYSLSDGNGGLDLGTVTVAVGQATFRVVDFAPNASGFDVRFNRALALDVLNLYDGLEDGPEAADLTLTRDGSPVAGSMVWDAAANTLSFVKTGGVLAAGDYTLTLRSGADAFRDASGELLDGDADGTGGDAYVHNFTVAAGSPRVVSLPDFARGAGQDVNVQAFGAGLTIRIDDATDVTAVDVDVMFDPTLLRVTGAALAAGLPGDWSIVKDLAEADQGIVRFSVSGQTALSGTGVGLITLTADVPDDAPYGASQVIRLVSVRVNEDQMASAADYALHKAAYVGDTTGNAGFSGVDATRIGQVRVGLATGFDAHDWTDPAIVGDTTGDGTISAQDASLVAQKSVHMLVPEIPDPPEGVTPIPLAGADPNVVIDLGYFGSRGDVVTVPVTIDDATGLLGANIEVHYATDQLDLANTDIRKGALFDGSWSMVVNVVDGSGVAYLVFWTNGDAHTGGPGTMAEIEFHIRADAPAGTNALDIEGELNEGGLVMTDHDGSLTVPIGVTITPDAGNDNLEGSAQGYSSSIFGQTGPAGYLWTVTQDGDPYAVTNNTSDTFTFTPDDGDAAYVVSLTATDSASNTGTDTETVAVGNVAPTPDAGGPYTINEGEDLVLSGSATDPSPVDQAALIYEWDVDNDGEFDDAVGAAPTIAWSQLQTLGVNDDGLYTVRIRVTDDTTSAVDTANLTIVNSPPVPAITGAPASSPEHSPISLSVEENDPSSADTFAYAWTVTRGGSTVAVGDAKDFAFTPDEEGDYEVSVVVTDDNGGSGSDSRTITVTHVTFRVVNIAPNASGFDVTFIRAAELCGLNLYDGLDAAADLPDLTVTRGGSAVPGSLVMSADGKTAQWVATGGALPAGEYVVTLASNSEAWRDARAGELLDGDSDGTVGDDHVSTITVDASAARVVGLPDFARGPDQAVDVPATAAGLPVGISDGTGVTKVRLEITYDNGLLHVTGAALAAGVPGDWTLDVADLTTDGRVVLEAHGATALSPGTQDVFALTAGVPIDATYGAGQIIDVAGVSLNDGAIAGVGDRAIHKAVYFGDATGNRGYSGLDATLIARLAAQLETGFDAFPLTDPVIIGDVNGSGALGAMDASGVASKSVFLSVPDIPDLPASNTPTVPVAGADPTLSFPDSLPAVPGSAANAALYVTDSAAGIKAIDLNIFYDTSLLDLSNGDVSLAGLLSGGWGLVTNVKDADGEAIVSAWSIADLGDLTGNLMDFAFHAAAGAQGTSALEITGQLNEGALAMTPDDGSIVVGSFAAGRHVFYNNSVYDGSDPLPNAGDDAAVAADRVALLAGELPTADHSTGYSKGINGVMVDIAGLADPEGLDISDFTFKAANTADPSGWGYAADPVSISVRQVAGADGSGRVTIVWADGAIQGTWLQVTVKAGGHTGLAADDVFYFGNMPGDFNGDGATDVGDLSLLAGHYRNPAANVNDGDANGDGMVDISDLSLLAGNYRQSLPDIDAIRPAGGTTESGASVEAVSAGDQTPTWPRSTVMAMPPDANNPSGGDNVDAIPFDALTAGTWSASEVRTSLGLPTSAATGGRALPAAALPRELAPLSLLLTEEPGETMPPVCLAEAPAAEGAIPRATPATAVGDWDDAAARLDTTVDLLAGPELDPLALERA